jgi:general stress protein YciG
MPWFMVDDQLAMNKKVAAAGNAAMGLWVRAGSWSQRELTGGFIPKHVARSLGSSAQAKALVSAGLWLLVEGGYMFHDWDKHQMSVEEIQARKQKRAEAGRLGGQASGQSRRAAGAEANASQVLKQNGTPVPGPVPLVVTKGGGVTQSDPEPPRYCDEHPNDTTEYCPPCIVRRKAHDAWKNRQKQREADELEQQRQKRAREAELLDACTECDEEGWRYDDREIKCGHPKVKAAAHA